MKPNLPILNPAHPLARKLLVAYAPYSGAGLTLRDVARHHFHGTLRNVDLWEPDRSLGFAGNESVDIAGVASANKTYTFVFRVRRDSDDDYQYIVDIESGRMIVGWEKDDQIRIYDGTWRAGVSIGLGEPPHDFAFVLDGDESEHNIWMDGVLELGAEPYTPTDIGDRVVIGAQYNNSTNNNLHGPLWYLYIYERMLSHSEIVALHANPYQMFLPQSRLTLAVTAAPTPPGTTDIGLAWTDNAEHEDGFTIERRTDGGAWEEIATGLAADTPSYTDSDLETGHTYEYRVKAESSTLGDSEWSNIAEETV